MNHLDSTPSHAEYQWRFNVSDNAIFDEMTQRIWDQLDFDERDKELKKLPRKESSRLMDEINSALTNHIDCALWLGWQMAKTPAAWLLTADGKISDYSPLDLLSDRMRELGLGYEDIFSVGGALGDAICTLFTKAENLAFALGVELQRDPDKLIFLQPRER